MSQHPYIKYIELKGYKSIKDLSCEFLPGLNILIGDNGSGKSNFFEFVSNCFQRNYNELGASFSAKVNYEAPVNDENNEDILIWKGIAPHIGGQIKSLTDLERRKITEEPSHSPIFRYVRFSLPELLLIGGELNLNYSDKEVNLAINDDKSILPYFLEIGLGFLVADLKTMSDDELNSSKLAEIINSFFEKIFFEFKRDVTRYSPIEDIKLSNAIRLAKLSADSYEIRNIVLEYKINGDWFSWDGLSDGTKRVVYLISEVIGANLTLFKNFEDVLIYPTVFLEEPEIGVHPHQLHQLLQFLKEKSETRQIFITTHSPQVLDILGGEDLDRIIIAEISSQRGTMFRHLNKVEKKKAEIYLKENGLLSDYWRFSDFQRTKA